MTGRKKDPSELFKLVPKEPSDIGSIPFWPNLARLVGSRGGALMLAYLELHWPDLGDGVEVDLGRLKKDLQLSHSTLWMSFSSIGAYHESLSAASVAKRSRREFYRSDSRGSAGPWKAYSMAHIVAKAYFLRRNVPVLQSWLDQAHIPSRNLDTQIPRAACYIFSPEIVDMGGVEILPQSELSVHAIRAAAAKLSQVVDPMTVIGGDRRRFTSAMNGGAKRKGNYASREAMFKPAAASVKARAERRKALKNIEADQHAFGQSEENE